MHTLTCAAFCLTGGEVWRGRHGTAREFKPLLCHCTFKPSLCLMTGDEVWPPLRPSRINHIHAHALGKQAYYRCRISARVERSWLRISPAPHLPFQVGGLSATSQQYFSLTTKQPARSTLLSEQNSHQPPANRTG
jgi:hypothetical protein